MSAAIFGHPTWTGPDHFEIVPEVWSVESFSTTYQPYLGPIAVLISNKSVSSAEHVCQIIRQNEHVTFIGQPNKRLDAAIYLHLWKDHDKQQCIFRTKKVKSKIGDMYSLNEVYNPEEKKWF